MKATSFEQLLGLEIINKMAQNRVDLFNKEFKSYELLQDGAARFEKQSGEQVEFSFLDLMAWLPSPKNIPDGRNVVWFGRVDADKKDEAEKVSFVQTAAAYRRAAMLPVDSNDLFTRIDVLLSDSKITREKLITFLHELQNEIFPAAAQETYIAMLDQEQTVLALEKFGMVFAENACYLNKEREKCYVGRIATNNTKKYKEELSKVLELIGKPLPTKTDEWGDVEEVEVHFKLKDEQNRRESDK